jgi:hypothetical protein
MISTLVNRDRVESQNIRVIYVDPLWGALSSGVGGSYKPALMDNIGPLAILLADSSKCPDPPLRPCSDQASYPYRLP